jgi:outer membrane lipoprotein SlyB
MRSRKTAKDKPGIITVVIVACCTVLQSVCTLVPYRQGGQPVARASEGKGAEVVVTLNEGSLGGELISVGADGLVIAKESGMLNSPWSKSSAVTAAYSDIKSVRVMKKKRVASGALIGSLLGIPLGVVAAKVSGVEANDWGDAIGKGSLFLCGGMIAGAIAGILLASSSSKAEVYVLEHRSDQEINKILIQLKRLARVEPAVPLRREKP